MSKLNELIAKIEAAEQGSRELDAEIADWFDLRTAVCNAAPDLDPPPQYWLESDCSASYCRKCAIVARGKEFELGPLLVDLESYRRDEWADTYFEGISSYGYRCAGEGDATAACYTCGITLDYWLTDYGIVEEIGHWNDSEMSGDLSEIAYNLDRLFECKDEDQPSVRALAERFLAHAIHAKAHADGDAP